MTLIIRFLCRRSFYFFFLVLPPPPRSTLFPYTTLFRSLYPFGWRDDVTAAAQRTGLDPFLVAAVVREESSYYPRAVRSEEHTSELQSRGHLVCRLLLEKKKNIHDTLHLRDHGPLQVVPP